MNDSQLHSTRLGSDAHAPSNIYSPAKTATSDRSTKAIDRKSRRSRWMMPLLSALVVAGLSGTVLMTRRPAPETNLAELTAPVQTQDLTIRVEASGSIVPISTVNISPKTTGRLAALYVDQGDAVKAGEVVARMDSADLEAQLAQAQAELTQAEAEYKLTRNGNRREEISRARSQVASAQAEADLKALQRSRYQSLAQEGAIAQSEFDQAVSEDRVAQANLQEAQQQLQELQSGSRPEEIRQAAAKVTAAQAQIKSIQAQLADTVIRAPFDGIVSQKYATVGAIVTPTTSASSTASATSSSIVALVSGLEVEVDVPEANIAQIKAGQQVEITADAYLNKTFSGRVKQISPEAVVENDVTSFEVQVSLHSGQFELRSGMTADVTFVGEAIKEAVVVPTVAIAPQEGQLGVMLLDEQGQAKFQPVMIGLSQDGQTQVLEGLSSGERVFVDFPEENSGRPNRN